MLRTRILVFILAIGLVSGAFFLLSSSDPEGDGRLHIEVTELPDGVPAGITVTGPEGFQQEVSSTTTLEDLLAGTYEVSTRPVEEGTDTFYSTTAGAPARVEDSRTAEVEVSYLTEVPETTEVLDESALDSLVSVSPRGKLVFSDDPDLEPGDVIVAGVSPEIPEGLLRRVTIIEQQGDEVTVRTEPAALDEAITRGELTLDDQPLSFEEVDRIEPLIDGVTFEEGSLVINIQAAPGKALSIPCGSGVKAEVKGRIELDPRFDFDADWGLFKGFSARSTITVDETAELSLKASGSAECSKDVELYRLYFTPIVVTLGPVPVVFTPVLTVNLGLNGEVSSELSVGAIQDASFTAGLSYEDGNVTPIKEFHSDFRKPQMKTAPLELSAQASAGPRLDLLLYGVVGPSLEAKGHLRLAVAPFERPWWKLFGGLKASARLSLDILSGRIKATIAEVKVIEWEKQLLAAKGEPPEPPEPTVPPGLIGAEFAGTIASGFSSSGFDMSDWQPLGSLGDIEAPADGHLWAIGDRYTIFTGSQRIGDNRWKVLFAEVGPPSNAVSGRTYLVVGRDCETREGLHPVHSIGFAHGTDPYSNPAVAMWGYDKETGGISRWKGIEGMTCWTGNPD